MAVLYDNRRPARKVAGLLWGAALLAVACLVWAATLLDDPTTALMVALAGLTPALLLHGFARHYLVRIEQADGELLIVTNGLGGATQRRVPADAVETVRFYNAEIEPGSPVRTPALLLYPRGKRLPFVVDLKAETADRSAIENLATGPVRTMRPPRSGWRRRDSEG